MIDAKVFLPTVTNQPGIYIMYSAEDVVLYVGKARHLKKRLTSYFRASSLAPKTRALMQQVVRIEVTVTRENEALLLEQSLIKQHRPRYNVLLRDDKTYPYIFVSVKDKYPRIDFYRGKRRKDGNYYGPFPNFYFVRDTINLLQKIFRIRTCRDSFFRARTRPCLLHQLNRCTAPCVKLISPEDYAQDVRHVVQFLEGKNRDLIKELTNKMLECSEQLDFEKAVFYRNQIVMLRQMQEKQVIYQGSGNIDALGYAAQLNHSCISLLRIRHGQVMGVDRYFQADIADMGYDDMLNAFISQHYCQLDPFDMPSLILTAQQIKDADWLAASLSENAKKKIEIKPAMRGDRLEWSKMASLNAQEALQQYLMTKYQGLERLQALQQLLKMAHPPQKIECFDISHMRGEATIASCVVFERGQPNKRLYRRYNIKTTDKGDDYAAMREVLTRRYQKLYLEQKPFPDLILIDGGKGQWHIAQDVFKSLEIPSPLLVGVAKGETRKAGLEQLFFAHHIEGLHVPQDAPALHLIQQIRDEAHRFAIIGHRQKRAKARNMSILQRIEGIGPERRRVLLTYFGGLDEVKRASADEIAKVPGISRALAETIYHALRDE